MGTHTIRWMLTGMVGVVGVPTEDRGNQKFSKTLDVFLVPSLVRVIATLGFLVPTLQRGNVYGSLDVNRKWWV